MTPTFAGLEVSTQPGALHIVRAQAALELVSRMPLARAPLAPHLDRSWQLRDNCSAYDAPYLALAETLQCPLVTSDRRLAAAPGAQCVIEVFD